MITWTDVAPRDGLQNLADAVSTEAKVRLVRGLLTTGIARVEATAMVSPRWVPQLADADAVLRALDPGVLPRVRVLIANERGLDRALDAGVRNVLLTIGATDAFNHRNVNRSVADSLAAMDAIARRARDAGCQLDVALSVAFGCPFDGPVDPERVVSLCAELLRRGAVEIGLADTIGVATPRSIANLVDAAAAVVPLANLSLHVHDTRGLGVANVLTAYQSGMRRFDGSAGGLGGCPFAPRSTGNVCSEDALGALAALEPDLPVDLGRYCGVSEQLATDLGRELPGKLYRAGVWPGSAHVEVP